LCGPPVGGGAGSGDTGIEGIIDDTSDFFVSPRPPCIVIAHAVAGIDEGGAGEGCGNAAGAGQSADGITFIAQGGALLPLAAARMAVQASSIAASP